MTVFEVSRDLLDSPDTRVRCGECLTIFDAQSSLYAVEEQSFDDAPTENLTDKSKITQPAPTPARSTKAADNAANSVGATAGKSAKVDNPPTSAGRGSAPDSGIAAGGIDAAASNPDPRANRPANKGQHPPVPRSAGKGKSSSSSRAVRGKATFPDLDALPDDELPEDALGDAGSDMDVTYSDFDLFSDDAALPEHAFLDETRDAIDLDFDQVTLEHDETFSDTLFNNDVTIDAALPLVEQSAKPQQAAGRSTAARPRAPTGFTGSNYQAGSVVEIDTVSAKGVRAEPAVTARASNQANPGQPNSAAPANKEGSVQTPRFSPDDRPGAAVAAASTQQRFREVKTESQSNAEQIPAKGVAWYRRSWFTNLVLGLVVAILALGLYAFQNRASLHNQASVRPLMLAWCFFAQCKVPPRFDKTQLRVLRKNVYSHPQEKQLLVINVVIRNTADFEQRYPILDVTLSDLTGRSVLSRAFLPQSYLAQNKTDSDSVLKAGETVDITLEVGDPGKEAHSFELMFR